MKRYIYHFIIICFFCLTLSGCRTAPTQEVSVLVESGSLSVLEGGDGLYDIQDEDIEDFDKISLVPIFMKKGVGTL
jgi:hypothetical protein